MAYLSLSILGPFQAWIENGQQQTFRTLKERALLAFLAVEHNRHHLREDLAELLWPDRPEGIARNNLRQALYGIRQVVGERGFEAIFKVTSREVQFVLSQNVWLDVAAFNVHLQAYKGHHQNRSEHCGYCLQNLHDSIELYRGSFMEDIQLEKNQNFQDWVTFHREQYHQQQMVALENMVDMYEAVGDFSQAALYMIRLVQMDGLNENQYRRLMLLLVRNGQLNAALEYYSLYRRSMESRGQVPSDEMAALAEQVQNGRFDRSLPSLSQPHHNLPEQLTAFFGREMELARLSNLLESSIQRLISIVGPGGVGKTRLAIQAAHVNAHLFPDGVFYIPLDSVLSVDRLAEYISRRMGLSLDGNQDIQRALVDYLRLKRFLLVLDNFDHLLEGRGLLLNILESTPFTKVIVTSRERLHTQAEVLVELEGLPYPKKRANNENSFVNYYPSKTYDPAVHLLLERAGQTRSRVLLPATDGMVHELSDPAELESVLRICQLVDGLPLGIELAAGWARDYSFAQIADEIQGSLEFLRSTLQDLPVRHRSLRASFEHSWDLLTESEQEMFGKLSVFPASFSARAAESVAGAAFPWLVRLVEKSLVRRFSIGRYDLHPLLRHYAGQKLLQFSRRAEDQVRQQHALFYSTFLSERTAGLRGECQVQALQEIEADLENIHAAWNWAIEHQAFDLLQRSAEGLFIYHESRSRWREGEALFGSAIACFYEDQGEQGVLYQHTLAYMLACQGWFNCRMTHFELASEQIQHSMQLLENAVDTFERAFAHFAMGFLSMWAGRFKEAWLYLTTSLRIAEKISDPWPTTWAKEMLTEIAFESGQSGNLPDPFLESLASFERVGDLRGISRSLNYLGNIAMTRGRYLEAQAYFEKMQGYLEQIGDIWGSASAYHKLGQLAEARREFEVAWGLFRRAITLFEKTGDLRRTSYSLGALGYISIVLGKDEDARHFFLRALKAAAQTRALSSAQEVLTYLAAASVHSQKEDQALRFLNLVMSIPVADQLTVQRAQRLLEMLGAGQPPYPARNENGLSGVELVWEEVDSLLQEGPYS